MCVKIWCLDSEDKKIYMRHVPGKLYFCGHYKQRYREETMRDEERERKGAKVND